MIQATEKQKRMAMLQVLLCAAMWSIAGIFIKFLPWNSFVISSLRSLFAGSIVIIYIKYAKIPFVLSSKTIKSGLALCMTMTLFVMANKYTTSANAIVLQFTAPMFIVVFSAIFLGQKFKKADVIAVLCTMAGISLFFFDEISGGKFFGNCVALCAGMAFACYYMSLGTSDLSQRMSTIIIANTMTFLIGLPFIFTTSPEFTSVTIANILILGVVQLGIPYIILAKASEYCPPLACSLLGAAEPLLNPVWVFIFDGEAPGLMSLVGGLFVIATISLWCVYNAKHDEKLAEVKEC